VAPFDIGACDTRQSTRRRLDVGARHYDKLRQHYNYDNYDNYDRLVRQRDSAGEWHGYTQYSDSSSWLGDY